MQSDKETLEKQLRTVKQERNALATTLRQHGFLGKQGRSSTGVQTSTPDHQPKHILPGICRQAVPAGCLTDNSLAASELTMSAANSHRRKQGSVNVSPQQSSQGRQIPADAAEISSFRDVTNLMPSDLATSSANTSAYVAPQTSKFDRSELLGQACHLVDRQDHIAQQPSEKQAMQARLHELEQLAQVLLL